MTKSAELCPCGQPLHYRFPDQERAVRRLVEDCGPVIPIPDEERSRTFLVPRHFMALHNMDLRKIGELAEQYGFEELS